MSRIGSVCGLAKLQFPPGKAVVSLTEPESFEYGSLPLVIWGFCGFCSPTDWLTGCDWVWQRKADLTLISINAWPSSSFVLRISTLNFNFVKIFCLQLTVNANAMRAASVACLRFPLAFSFAFSFSFVFSSALFVYIYIWISIFMVAPDAFNRI